jgi:hypothetical protein
MYTPMAGIAKFLGLTSSPDSKKMAFRVASIS